MKVSLEQLPEFVSAFLKEISLINSDTSLLVELSGNLGAGKTTFTQEIAKQLKISEIDSNNN